MLLVAVSVATGVAVTSQERALRQGSARAADDFDLLLGAHGSPTQLLLTSIYLRPQAIPLLDGDVLQDAATAPGVRYAAPIAFGDNWQGYPIIGTISEFVSRGGTLAPAEGRLFSARGEAVIGASVKLALGARISPQHGQRRKPDDDGETEHAAHEHSGVSYHVIGRLPPRGNIWDTAILIPVEDVWAAHGLPTGHAETVSGLSTRLGPPWTPERLPGVPAIAVKPDSVSAAYSLRAKFRTPRSISLFPAEVLNDLYLTLGNVRDLMAFLALATQILVVAAVLTALLVGFLARSRQFAILRAIGASRLYVFYVVWGEVVMLIGCGALVGMAMGYGVSTLLAACLQAQTGFVMPVSLGAPEALLVGGLLLAGALIAVLPAWLAFRRSIAQGLSA
ncbi:FtsX-like permease family protein [Propionivibrio dicarboxylicus]|uniref:Putative ABC transport system permease protein n=1 Tax=Propionivibrio dicarboxylicus TaxID=83767 RepID=A0A1G8ESG5_9RHOO|nr:ABC transporter permease [Propionivibrio dicarboxylicus]SDH72851.1 putative ABC transport system permease protein [Propionivibrio dicarboxylicus]